MGKVKVITKRDNPQQKDRTMWDKAIEDARRLIKRLETAVRFFEESRDAGEGWPGEEEARSRASASTHK
jgi:hypothetical protein